MNAAETPVTLTADRYGRRVWQHTAPTAAQLATARAERDTRPAPARDPFARIPHTDESEF